MNRTADLPTPPCPAGPRASTAPAAGFLTGVTAGTAVITAAHRGTPVGLLLTTLAPVSAAAGVFSFSLSGLSYAWPALEKATLVGIHLLGPGEDPVEARIAEDFARTRVDGFLPGIAWHPGPDGVPLLDGVRRRTVARLAQKIHAGSHVVVVARVVDGPESLGTAA